MSAWLGYLWPSRGKRPGTQDKDEVELATTSSAVEPRAITLPAAKQAQQQKGKQASEQAEARQPEPELQQPQPGAPREAPQCQPEPQRAEAQQQVQQQHEQQQQQQQQQQQVPPGTDGGPAWPAKLLAASKLWGDEGEEDCLLSREERTLRAWVNSLLHHRGTSSDGGDGAGAEPCSPGPRRFCCSNIQSLLGPEVRSGVLLLELLDTLAPGAVDWAAATRPSEFRALGIAAELQALENCQQALRVAKDVLGLPLVSIDPRDLVAGRRKPVLSLMWQLSRVHLLQMLAGLAAAHTGKPQQQQQAQQQLLRSVSSGETGRGEAQGVPLKGSRLAFKSSSTKQRSVGLQERSILDWINAKLASVQPLTGGAAATAPVLSSLSDGQLASGVVLLQLLHALDPRLVDVAFVSPGLTRNQRASNARYALACADRLGAQMFISPEDLLDLHPRPLLMFFASLMIVDLQRQ